MPKALNLLLLAIGSLFCLQSLGQTVHFEKNAPAAEGFIEDLEFMGPYQLMGGHMTSAGIQVNGFAVFDKKTQELLNPFPTVLGDIKDAVAYKDGWILTGNIDSGDDSLVIGDFAFLNKDFELIDSIAPKLCGGEYNGPDARLAIKGDTLFISDISFFRGSGSNRVYYRGIAAYSLSKDTLIWFNENNRTRFSARVPNKMKLYDSLLMISDDTHMYFDAGKGWTNSSPFIVFNANTGNLANLSPVPDGDVSDFIVYKNRLYIVGDFDKVDQYTRKNFVSFRVKSGLVGSWTPTIDPNGHLSGVGDNIIYTPVSSIGRSSSIYYLNVKNEEVDTSQINLDDTARNLASFGVRHLTINDTLYVSNNFNIWTAIDVKNDKVIKRYNFYKNGLSEIGEFKYLNNKFIFMDRNMNFIPRKLYSGLLVWDDQNKHLDRLGDSISLVKQIEVDGDNIYCYGKIGSRSYWRSTEKYEFFKLGLEGKISTFNDGGFLNQSGTNIEDMLLYKGQLLLAGSFVNNGTTYPLALFNLSTSNVQYLGGSTDGRAFCMALDEDTVYLGGKFKDIDGRTRDNIAAIDLDNDKLLSWAPAANGQVTGIRVLNQDSILAAGAFTSIGGRYNSGKAVLNKVSGASISKGINQLRSVNVDARAQALLIDTFLFKADAENKGSSSNYLRIYATSAKSENGFYAFDVFARWGGNRTALDASSPLNSYISLEKSGRRMVLASNMEQPRSYPNGATCLWQFDISEIMNNQSLKLPSLNKPSRKKIASSCDNFSLEFENNNPAFLHIISTDSNKSFKPQDIWYSQKTAFSEAHYFDSVSYVVGHSSKLNMDDIPYGKTRYIYTYASSGYGDSVAYSSQPIVTKLVSIAPFEGISLLTDTIQCENKHAYILKSNVSDSLRWKLGNGVEIANTDSVNYQYPQHGVYTIMAEYSNSGCNGRDSVKIEVLKSLEPAATFITDSLHCLGQYVDVIAQVSDTLKPTYQWKINGMEIPIGITDTLRITDLVETATISLVIKNDYECTEDSALAAAILRIDSLNTTALTKDFSQCLNGNEFSFDAQTQDQTTWNLGDGNTLTTNGKINYTYSAADTFAVEVTKRNNFCQFSHEFEVKVLPNINPDFQLVADSVACVNTNFNVDVLETNNSDWKSFYNTSWTVNGESKGVQKKESLLFNIKANSTVEATFSSNYQCAEEPNVKVETEIVAENSLRTPTISIDGNKIKSDITAPNYTWLKNGVDLEADSAEITARGPGRYVLRVSNSCGFKNSNRLVIEEDDGNSLANYIQPMLQVYPNPADEQITIDIPDNESLKYQLINAQGKTMIKGSIRGITSLAVGELHRGIYLLSVEGYKSEVIIIE